MENNLKKILSSHFKRKGQSKGTGLKSGATICIAPPELALTVLRYFIRAL